MTSLGDPTDDSRRERVLILCTHNAARSQMAEGLLRARAGDRFEVHSAGYEPSQVHPLAVEAMADIGIDISGQRSKGTKDYLGHVWFRYLIIVCARAEEFCPTVFPGVGERLSWPFDDPSAAEGSHEERLAVFRRVRDAIDQRLSDWLTTAEQDVGLR